MATDSPLALLIHKKQDFIKKIYLFYLKVKITETKAAQIEIFLTLVYSLDGQSWSGLKREAGGSFRFPTWAQGPKVHCFSRPFSRVQTQKWSEQDMNWCQYGMPALID